MEKKATETPAAATTALATIPDVHFNSGLDLYLNKDRMEQLYKVANMFAGSDIVPAQFQKAVGNCFIALDMASNMGVPPLFLMQNLVMVKGKPTLEAKLVTAMVNSSGRFASSLDYEVVGTDASYDIAKKAPRDPSYKVRCFATRKKDDKTLYGPWITWDMVIGEGWVQKDGSKWRTMPEMMFMYRAASYFSKQHCTDLTFGMQTTEEMRDVIDITPAATRGAVRVDRAKTVLEGFNDEPDPAAATAENEDTPEGCSHPYDNMEEVDGVPTCTLCGEVIPAGYYDPSPEEQEQIRLDELKLAGEQQDQLFKD